MKRKEITETVKLNEVGLLPLLIAGFMGYGLSRSQAQQAAQTAASSDEVQNVVSTGQQSAANNPTVAGADAQADADAAAGMGSDTAPAQPARRRTGVIVNGQIVRRGPEVEQLQRDLGMSGSDVDGLWGPNTEAAVRRFQETNGIAVDGIVGPDTRAKIANAQAAGAVDGDGPEGEVPADQTVSPDARDAERERAAAQAPNNGAPEANPNRQAGSTAPSQLRLRREVLPAIDQLLSQVTPGGR